MSNGSDSAGLEPTDTSSANDSWAGGRSERLRLLRAAAKALEAENEHNAASEVTDAISRIEVEEARAPR